MTIEILLWLVSFVSFYLLIGVGVYLAYAKYIIYSEKYFNGGKLKPFSSNSPKSLAEQKAFLIVSWPLLTLPMILVFMLVVDPIRKIHRKTKHRTEPITSTVDYKLRNLFEKWEKA